MTVDSPDSLTAGMSPRAALEDSSASARTVAAGHVAAAPLTRAALQKSRLFITVPLAAKASRSALDGNPSSQIRTVASETSASGLVARVHKDVIANYEEALNYAPNGVAPKTTGNSVDKNRWRLTSRQPPFATDWLGVNVRARPGQVAPLCGASNRLRRRRTTATQRTDAGNYERDLRLSPAAVQLP
jgi:hypothetical protein